MGTTSACADDCQADGADEPTAEGLREQPPRPVACRLLLPATGSPAKKEAHREHAEAGIGEGGDHLTEADDHSARRAAEPVGVQERLENAPEGKAE